MRWNVHGEGQLDLFSRSEIVGWRVRWNRDDANQARDHVGH